MTHILILAAFVAFSRADVSLNAVGGYSSGSFVSAPARTYLPPQVPTSQRESVISDNYVPKVFKHAYVFSSDEPITKSEKRIIRVSGGDKHVNLIFVKVPEASQSQQTEVVLPEPDQQKNIVYVLLRKVSAEENVKITRPQVSSPPTKPEVHFIRYQENDANSSPISQQPEKPLGLYGTPSEATVPALQPSEERPSGLYETLSSDPLSPPHKSQQESPAFIPPNPHHIRKPSGLYETPSQ